MTPTLALTDYNALRRLLRYPGMLARGNEVQLLEKELNKATVIDDQKVSEEVVRLNSHVKVQDVQTGKITEFQIVMPSHADFKLRKMSVLAPMSIALLGFKKGDSFNWEMPGGVKRIRIISVENDEPDLAA